MEKKKIKIAWVCEFSNPLVREHLAFRSLAFENFCRFLMGKPAKIMADYDQWITNGIEEMQKFDKLELHVVSFHNYIKRDVYEFESGGVYYHILKSEEDVRFLHNIFRRLLKKSTDKEYKRNRKAIKRILAAVNPDIVHYYGAENPEYSISALDIDNSKTPLIVSLQTLMSSPEFKNNYPITEESYDFRAGIEKEVIRHATFIGTTSKVYKDIILDSIKSDALFLKISLMIAEKINVVKCEKKYDFVYYAANIGKAADLAIEAFIIAASKRKGITLCVIGDYMPEFKESLEKRLLEHGLKDNVTFTGRLATHDDVLEGVRKARFALLPLKVDLISGTIREAMALGLTVVTTKTAGTPLLNQNRESVLITEIGDNEAMAENMIKLLDDENFGENLAENALTTYREKYDNSSRAADLMRIYEAVFNNDYKKCNMVKIALLVTCHNRKDKTVTSFGTLFAALNKYNASHADSERIDITTFLTDDGCTDGTADAVRQIIGNQEYNVIQGDGNMFWNGGMRAAWNEALKRHEEWDFYLLINDDTDIMDNAFDELMKTHNYCIEKYGRDGVYSGITCSKTDDTVSYGGTVFTNRFLAKTKQLGPTGEPQMCDLTNANILMVSKDVVDKIGIFWEGYKHGIADSDYAMKARKHGIPVLLTSCFVGRCNYDHDNDKEESAKVMAMSLSERRRYFNKPTRSNRDYLKFVWRHETLRLPMVLFGRFMNVYFPKVYYSMKNKANAD